MADKKLEFIITEIHSEKIIEPVAVWSGNKSFKVPEGKNKVSITVVGYLSDSEMFNLISDSKGMVKRSVFVSRSEGENG